MAQNRMAAALKEWQKRADREKEFQRLSSAQTDRIDQVPVVGRMSANVEPKYSLGDRIHDLSVGIGRGLGEQAVDTLNMIAHPVQTARTLYDAARSAITNPSATARQMADALRKDYGQITSGNMYDAGETLGKYLSLRPKPRNVGKYDPTVSKISDFDPRFDKRVKEREKLQKLTPVVESRGTVSAPDISITELEGMPFITSMSDRAAAGGLLKAINDVELSRPVDLRGGQDFMFENPGMVWSSGKTPTKQIKELAEEIKVMTGENPLYLPWRMAPSGVDFAAMTGEAMLNYADASLSKSAKRQLDAELKAIIPNWAGVSNPKSVQQYQNAKASDRKKIQRGLDKNFREQGGLGLGEARLSVTDPRQYVAPDAGVQNVGRIFADKPLITASGHPSYPIGVPGEGIGRIKENVNIFELLEPVAKARNIPDPKAPRQTDVRALQMKPYYGRITADLLKKMGF